RADAILVHCLARGLTAQAAAEAAHVSRKLVFLRLQRPEFVEKVAAERGKALERGRGALAQGLREALAKLRELARSDDPQVALKAATALARLALPGKLAVALGIEDLIKLGQRREAADFQRRERRGFLDVDEQGHARLIDSAGNVLEDLGQDDDD